MAEAEVGIAYVTLAASAKDFVKSVAKEMDGLGPLGDRKGKESGDGFTGGFKSSLGKIAGIASAAIAGAGLVNMFQGFITEAAESAKIGRLTEQVIQSTGGAAKITAGQVGELATAISNKTAVDDEAIQSASNLLLTFTKVRNEAGEGNDIFNQATQAAVDMSVALGQDANGAALQLGKALNDPIKGITALGRAGVSFTEQQKEQIKTLTESGDVLGAQKIILGEMQTQFGGAAAAAADPLQRLKVIAGNLGEEIGGFLLPHAERFATSIADKVIPGVKGLFDLLVRGDFTGEFARAFGVAEDSGIVDFLFRLRDGVINTFSEIKGALTAFVAAWQFNDGQVTSSGLPGFMERLGFYARQTFDFLVTTAIPAAIELTRWLVEHKGVVIAVAAAFGALNAIMALHAAVLAVQAVGGLKAYIAQTAIVQTATRAWAAVQWLLNAAMSANPIGIVIVAIAALVAGLIWAWHNIDGFKEGVLAAWNWILRTSLSVWTAIKDWIRARVEDIVGVAVRVLEFQNRVVGFFTGLRDKAIQKTVELVTWVTGLPGRLISAVGDLGEKFLNVGRDIIDGIIRGVTNGVGRIKDAVTDAARAALDAAKDFLGISSPSKVFDREVGAMMTAGATRGVLGGIPKLQAAVDSMVAVPAVSVPGASTFTVGGLPAAGAGGAGVIVNQTINPQQGQSEYEIGRISADQMTLAARR